MPEWERIPVQPKAASCLRRENCTADKSHLCIISKDSMYRSDCTLTAPSAASRSSGHHRFRWVSGDWTPVPTLRHGLTLAPECLNDRRLMVTWCSGPAQAVAGGAHWPTVVCGCQWNTLLSPRTGGTDMSGPGTGGKRRVGVAWGRCVWISEVSDFAAFCHFFAFCLFLVNKIYYLWRIKMLSGQWEVLVLSIVILLFLLLLVITPFTDTLTENALTGKGKVNIYSAPSRHRLWPAAIQPNVVIVSRWCSLSTSVIY